MRILSRTVALLAVSGCMSNTARVGKNRAASREKSATHSRTNVEAAEVTPSAAQMPATPVPAPIPAPKIVPGPAPIPVAVVSEQALCDALKKEVDLPYFMKETSALVVSIDQTCKETTAKGPALLTNMSVIGVSCTGAPGIITRRGHSNQNWEVVTFGMDLGCNMHPSDEVKVIGKRKLGMDVDPHIVSFVPMMIEYWEFEQNNDAGLGSTPTLTASGGGAAQWKKNETKSTGFPIKLYGHSSTIGKDQSVYEARAILLPKSNQRQFEVLVQEMKLLSSDELKVTLDRCMAKTNAKSGCSEAFENQ